MGSCDFSELREWRVCLHRLVDLVSQVELKQGNAPIKTTETNELPLTFVMSCLVMPLLSFCK